jgi:DNA-binding cell septation regulator SpoVG
MESLDVLLVLHFILVIKGEEGLGVGVSHVPKLEG